MSGIPWAKAKTNGKKQRVPWFIPIKKASINPVKPKTPSRQTELGQQAEALATKFLEQKGLRLVAQNFRCKCGELDIVMQENKVAVIVEVKLRNNQSRGDGTEAVTRNKQRKVTHCAQRWWSLQPKDAFNGLRFDVVSVRKDEIERWVKNAWQAPI